MVFLLDLGKRQVVRADGGHHAPIALSFDRYAYRFGQSPWPIVLIGRYDGAMELKRFAGSGQRGRASIEHWTCATVKPGQAV
jgi:hypothetical protein